MWNKLTYRQKLKWLGIGSLLLLIICYKFSIARTVTEYSNYKTNSRLALQLNAESGSGEVLQTKTQRVNELLEQYRLDTIDNSKNLLSIVGNFCNDHQLQLKEYLPLSVSQSDSLQVLTRSVTVEGSFINCLQLTHALEMRYKAGKVSSVQFKSQADITKNEIHLYCTIYIQNLITSLYEK
jgi:hypothetical protein